MAPRDEVTPPKRTVPEMVAEMLEHGGLPVETALVDGSPAVLRSILHVDGDVVTHVSPALLGTPEHAAALVMHAKALRETIDGFRDFARSFRQLRPLVRWAAAVVPPLVDAIVERHPVHAAMAFVASGGLVGVVSLVLGAGRRKNARAVADAVHALRKKR
jgi:hypothetical protein